MTKQKNYPQNTPSYLALCYESATLATEHDIHFKCVILRHIYEGLDEVYQLLINGFIFVDDRIFVQTFFDYRLLRFRI